MAYIGKPPNTAIVNQATSQSFSGNGSTTAFTLTRSVNVGEDLEVFVNNVQQEPGSGKSYTASGTTLTFDEAPPSGTNNIYVIYRGEATINPRLEHDANAALAATTGTFSGDVGIGETAPVTPLTIATTNKLGSTFTGNTNGEGLTVTQTDYTSGNYVSLVEAPYDDSNDANPNVRIGVMFDGGGSNLAFGTSNNYGTGITNTAMFINSSGNVGINTASPSGANLEIFTGSTAADGLKINRFGSGVYYSTLRQDSHGLAFHVGNGSAIAERAAITPNGITFGGQTAADNALDSYEEGTFVPAYAGFTMVGAPSSNTGRFTKIGNFVYVAVDLQNVTWTGGGGQLSITNLPFANGAQRTFTGTFAWYYLVSNLGTADALAGYIAGGTSTLLMYASQNNHVWHTIATPSSGSNGYFNGTFVYRT